ncbi:MAG: hypothetical protein LBB49_04415, partial [Gracilibacteraceae bacterium]|nr:hypothetical protein [Gracilibacteraceae bacterium]
MAPTGSDDSVKTPQDKPSGSPIRDPEPQDDKPRWARPSERANLSFDDPQIIVSRGAEWLFSVDDFKILVTENQKNADKINQMYDDAVNLQAYVMRAGGDGGWQGKTQREYLAFLDLVMQYHERLRHNIETQQGELKKFVPRIETFADKNKYFKDLDGEDPGAEGQILHAVKSIYKTRDEQERDLANMFIASSSCPAKIPQFSDKLEKLCREVDNDPELTSTGYVRPKELEREILSRLLKLSSHSLTISSKVDMVDVNLVELYRDANHNLASAADLSQYGTANTLDIMRNPEGKGCHNRPYHAERIGFADFMFPPSLEHGSSSEADLGVVLEDFGGQGNYNRGYGPAEEWLYVKSFADLFKADYEEQRNLLWAYNSGVQDPDARIGVPSHDEYLHGIMTQGMFNPGERTLREKVARAILDATIIVPLYEAISGNSVTSKYKLTDNERLMQGASAVLDVALLLIPVAGVAGKGIKGGGALVASILGEVATNILVGTGFAAGETLLMDFLENNTEIPPEAARLLSLGFSIAMVRKLYKLNTKKIDT